MAKFRTRETVDAQQWEPGVPMEGVTKTGGGYGVVNTPMGNVEVKPGFWVVTDRDGKRHVMNPEAFEAAFGPAETELEAWSQVAAESNHALDAYLREVDPTLPEHYGMPVDGVRQVVEKLQLNLESLRRYREGRDGLPPGTLSSPIESGARVVVPSGLAAELAEELGTEPLSDQVASVAHAMGWLPGERGHRGGPISAERGAPQNVELPAPPSDDDPKPTE